ncbi:pickpocket protein 28-like [Uranotaenia lowii]|uniref:pickpocket protein 28-like n=1 Tax=Uranotaenia lowii TaxID=190385 RepID=UPI00247A8070|nr:pickpocket protein 28-like [Uranotaenia lowii]
MTCIASAYTTYQKWSTDPIVIVYAPLLLPVSTIPFPAITICPLVKTRANLVNLTEALEMISNNITLDDEIWKLSEPYSANNISQMLNQVSLSFIEVMEMCSFQLEPIACYKLMANTLLDEGICYTFNALPANETYREDVSTDFFGLRAPKTSTTWSRETGYRTARIASFPRQGLSSGELNGAFFGLKTARKNHDPLCSGPFTGYKVSIHPPDEIPVIGERFLRLSQMNVLLVNVKPQIIRSSQSLKNISPKGRSCYFEDERYLRYFRRYNQINCAHECISNLTLSKCGCVKFSMPRLNDTPVCGTDKLDCFRTIFIDMYSDRRLREICDCKPPCNSITYDTEVSHLKFNFHKYIEALSFSMPGYGGYDITAISVGYKERHFLALYRRELVSVVDAIAKLGGLFSLALGSSALSIAEIFYYCFIRPLRRATNRLYIRTSDYSHNLIFSRMNLVNSSHFPLKWRKMIFLDYDQSTNIYRHCRTPTLCSSL